MDLENYFISCEFDTGTKIKSIEKIAKMAGINAGMKKCLLFDDETRNIRDISSFKDFRTRIWKKVIKINGFRKIFCFL